MADLLKNVYNESFFDVLTNSIVELKPDFKKELFLKETLDKDWERKELKERMRHITLSLNNSLSNNYLKDLELLIDLIPILKKNGVKTDSLAYIFMPDYIEVFGLNEYDESIKAIEIVTQFVTCEFAIRPFLKKYYKSASKQMLKWSLHENFNVRRLASEGIRPRLPWAIGIPELKNNPELIFPILENLKDDEFEYVRRSVANNLNDISKDHPDLVISIAQKWFNETKNRQKLIKHASRTLLKQGNQELMILFGFGSIDQIKVKDLVVKSSLVKVGEYLEFEFKLVNENVSDSKIRLEYAIYFLKANGTLAKKVFKISEKEYKNNSKSIITKKQSFKPITTRKYYEGEHAVSIIVNGVEFLNVNFQLMM